MEAIEYYEGAEVFEGNFFEATGGGVRPCIILGHAWDGPNEIIYSIARDLALRGIHVFSIDVYGKGIRGKIDGDNSALMAPFMADRNMLHRRLLKGFETAQRIDGVDATKMYALGFCFGGLCVLDLARLNPSGLVKTVAVHSILNAPENLEMPSKIESEVLLLHGWEDPVAKPKDLNSFFEELTAKRCEWSAQIFGKTKHAFTLEGANLPELGVEYNEHSAKSAWSAIYQFFHAGEKLSA